MIKSHKIYRTHGSRNISGHLLPASALLKLILYTTWLTISAAHAEIYKWVDDKGRIHYSEVPPSSSDSEIIVPRSSPTKTNLPETKKKPQSQSFQQKDNKLKQTDEKTQTTAENERIREKNCTIAKNNLKTLQSGGRIRLREGDEYRFLSSEEQKEKIAQAKKQIEQFCD